MVDAVLRLLTFYKAHSCVAVADGVLKGLCRLRGHLEW